MTDRFSRLLLCFFPLLLMVGCAPAITPVTWETAGVEWVYPQPPQQARIKFLRQISGLEDVKGTENKTSKKIFDWFGETESEQLPMVAPYAVAADGDGRIWLTDPTTGIVHFIDLPHRELSHFSIVAGRQLYIPTGIAFDAQRKRLFIADAGTSEVIVLDDEYNYLLSLVPPGGFSRPAGMTIDAQGNLYVADALKGTIEVFSAAGRYLKSLGSALSENGHFNRPSNVAVDPQGRVYVVDSFNFRVEILGLAGEQPIAIGTPGDSSGNFARPRGIAIDSAGHIYVADAAFDNIQIFNRHGKLLLYFGQPGEGPDGLCLPAGLYFDRSDRLYVANSCDHQVKIFQFLAE